MAVQTYYWASGISGEFNVASNWNPASVPWPGAFVVTNKAPAAGNSYTIHAGSNWEVGKISINNEHAIVQVSGAELKVSSGLVKLGGTLQLDSFSASANSSMTITRDTILRGTDVFSAPGVIALSDPTIGGSSSIGSLPGAGGSVSLTLEGQLTVQGAGQIGDAAMSVTNKGSLGIDGDVVLDTGAHTVRNLGDIKVLGGSLIVKSTFYTMGNITADGNIHFLKDVTVSSTGGLQTDAPGVQVEIDGNVKNANFLTVSYGSMTIHGTVNNQGWIGTNSVDPTATLVLQSDLHNAGHLQGNFGHTEIMGATVNTIDGSVEAFENGVIDFDGAVVNHGLMDTAEGGLIKFHSTLNNHGGTLTAYADSTISVTGALTGGGAANIVDSGIIEFDAASNADVDFSGDMAGQLILDDAQHFKGGISGFADADHIDLTDFILGSTKWSYKDDTTSHVTTLTFRDQTDPTHIAQLNFAGDYQKAEFAVGDDGHGHITVQHHDVVVI